MNRFAPAAALSVLLLTGCSTLSGPAPALSSRLPAQAELASVPFFPQEKYQCGPAALATVLGHHGQSLTPELLAPQVYLPGREGSLQPELKAAARRAGMVPYQIAPQLNSLLTEVAAGNPVLVLQNLGLTLIPQWHYAVVVGFDQSAQQLILRSGTEKRRLVDLTTFMNTWRRSGNWGLVVTPADRLPATASATEWLQSAHALAGVAMADAAEAMDTATRRWPARSEMWLAAGNMHYSLKNYDGASQRYAAGLALHPRDGGLWNNYAYSLKAQGCGRAALAAVRCAVAHAPDNNQYQGSLAELLSTTASRNRTASCPTISCELAE